MINRTNGNLDIHGNGSAWRNVTPGGLANVGVEGVTQPPGSTQIWAMGEFPHGGEVVAYLH